jgi:HK97 family phage portal protein
MESPTLNAKDKPSWIARRIKGIATTFWPEVFEQEQGGPVVTRWGVINSTKTKDGRKVFGEISGTPNQFVIDRPSGGNRIDAERALLNNKGFVYAAVNAKAREVMAIDWRLFETDGDDNVEQKDHDILDLLDGPSDNMNGLEFKYILSASLDLAGSCYVWMEGVKNDLDRPKALHIMPVDKVRPVIDRRSWPYQLLGYRLKLPTSTVDFKPYEVIHFREPNVADHFEGYSPVMAGAEYIDNDNYAMEFNRKFFVNGARPSGFLETNFVAENQLDALKIGFTDAHGGIDNMNRIGVLPNGVKWAPAGSSPKDMDFKNMSEDMRDRILAMFGVSRTILGTAESDTNRATAETADYVFSKRVVKPHMMNICATLNDRLVSRYGDNLYISFIDPVPEDKAFRTTEMQAAMGNQPLMTPNEGRDAYLGLGPVDGGDSLFVSTSFAPIGSDTDGDGGGGEGADSGGKPQSDTDPKPQDDDPNAKAVRKDARFGNVKAANGLRVGYRPARTKMQKLAKKRETMRTELASKIKADLEARFKAWPSKKFESTKEQDEARFKEFSEFTQAAEKDFAATVRKLNAEQKKEVLANLPEAVKKAIDPADLFDIKNWISITTDALTPVMETLFEHQALAAVAEIGKPELNPFNDTTRAAVHASVQMMSESYNQTTLAALESHINDGLTAGESLADITKRVEQVYEWSDESRAAAVARTESFRTANSALKSAWQQSGVVKTVKWYTSEKDTVCAYCQAMDGKSIPIDDDFFKNGASLTVGEGDSAQTMSLDYGDVGAPPLHTNCQCMIRPDEISID